MPIQEPSIRRVLSPRALALCVALAACSARGGGGGFTATGDGGGVTAGDGGTTRPGDASRDAGVPPTDVGGPGPVDECAGASDCARCTGRSSCGWCAGRCWRGTSSGPTGGSCGDTPWAWTPNQCGGAPPPRDGGVAIDPACQACAFSSCGGEASACMADSACIQCVIAPSAACASNPRFASVARCACGACAEACGSLCAAF